MTKKIERTIYLGHICAEDVMLRFHEDIFKELEECKKENDIKECGFYMERRFTDRYPVYDGYYYGKDIFMIVRDGHWIEKEIIEKFRKIIFKERW